LIGPRSAAGIHPAHVSGLEARWTAEVAHAAAGISRGEADALVRPLVERYKPDLEQRPIGQPFQEVYDPVTLKPRPAWQELYEAVKAELGEMGLTIP
jgi:hypothetical protein